VEALSVNRAVTYRRLGIEDMEAASRVFRTTFDARLPWLAGLHAPHEDRAFWEGQLFSACEIWGAALERDLLGVIAFRDGWVDQLYVLPAWQGQGIGTRLLDEAKSRHSELSLWTFQKNSGARIFYERHGFSVVTETDGSANEEKEPDALYRWRR
jgi:putative acetyltransferase